MFEKLQDLVYIIIEKSFDLYPKNDLNTNDNVYFDVRPYGSLVLLQILVCNKIFYLSIKPTHHDKGVSVEITELKYHGELTQSDLQEKGSRNVKWDYNQDIKIERGPEAIYEEIKKQTLKLAVKLNKKSLYGNRKTDLNVEFSEKFKKTYENNTYFLTSLNDAFINYEKKMLDETLATQTPIKKSINKI